MPVKPSGEEMVRFAGTPASGVGPELIVAYCGDVAEMTQLKTAGLVDPDADALYTWYGGHVHVAALDVQLVF